MTRTGASAGTVDLDETIFGIEPNVAVMHQVVTAQLAAARSGTQSTLTRAEVRGGGAKPWRQKGTGRARQGSTRAPHWAGGGVALGPKPRSYRQKTPKKMIQLALRSALSDRASEGRVGVIEAWDFPVAKTKDAKAALGALGFSGKVLLVISPDDDTAHKAFRNLPEVHVLLAGELNAYDVLCSDWVVFTRATLPVRPGAASQGGAPTDAPVHEPVTTEGEVANTIAPQVGVEDVAQEGGRDA
ncbi:MAG: 50S ribosomal protein L4 [Actinobacteria bacterium]|nr:50S ribosomal protein L4 [Actinomycetota bacterium]